MSNGEMREKPAAPPVPETGKNPELPTRTESGREAAPKGAEARAVEAERQPAPPASVAAKRPEAPPEAKDKYRVRVERALEQNLWDLYFALPQGVREKFKEEGETAAAALRAAIETKRVRPSTVLHAVNRWLKTIPKVNPYFLEQEAKIKTDKIMELVKERRKEEGLE
ncbi:MAG: hypothetical protein RL272_514 [Candidatus Parcubacteria bacterium]|jgi:hypothetical protein